MSLVVQRASGVLGSGLYTSTPPRCLFVRPRGLLDHQLEVNDPEAVLPVVFDVPGPRSALYVDDYARWKQVMYDILLIILYIYISKLKVYLNGCLQQPSELIPACRMSGSNINRRSAPWVTLGQQSAVRRVRN